MNEEALDLIRKKYKEEEARIKKELEEWLLYQSKQEQFSVKSDISREKHGDSTFDFEFSGTNTRMPYTPKINPRELYTVVTMGENGDYEVKTVGKQEKEALGGNQVELVSWKDVVDSKPKDIEELLQKARAELEQNLMSQNIKQLTYTPVKKDESVEVSQGDVVNQSGASNVSTEGVAEKPMDIDFDFEEEDDVNLDKESSSQAPKEEFDLDGVFDDEEEPDDKVVEVQNRADVLVDSTKAKEIDESYDLDGVFEEEEPNIEANRNFEKQQTLEDLFDEEFDELEQEEVQNDDAIDIDKMAEGAKIVNYNEMVSDRFQKLLQIEYRPIHKSQTQSDEQKPKQEPSGEDFTPPTI